MEPAGVIGLSKLTRIRRYTVALMGSRVYIDDDVRVPPHGAFCFGYRWKWSAPTALEPDRGGITSGNELGTEGTGDLSMAMQSPPRNWLDYLILGFLRGAAYRSAAIDGWTSRPSVRRDFPRSDGRRDRHACVLLP